MVPRNTNSGHRMVSSPNHQAVAVAIIVSIYRQFCPAGKSQEVKSSPNLPLRGTVPTAHKNLYIQLFAPTIFGPTVFSMVPRNGPMSKDRFHVLGRERIPRKINK